MNSPATPPAVQRDLSVQRLRDLTFASAAAAAGLVGVFSIVAAITVPGHSDAGGTGANTTTDTTATDPNQSSFSQPAGDDSTTDGGQLQPPAQAPVSQPVAAAPHVVSGGSR